MREAVLFAIIEKNTTKKNHDCGGNDVQTTSMELKKLNRNRIYRLIAREGPIAKSEIASKLSLSLPTVTQNLNALKEMNLISEEGAFESTGGRRARIITCNAMARVAVGINITRNHIGVVLVDLLGNVVDCTRERFPYEDGGRYYAHLSEMVEGILERNRIQNATVLGVGVSIPAIVNGDRRTLDTALVIPFPDNLYEKLKEQIDLPFYFFNDANSGGYAEFWCQQSGKDLFYLSLSGTVGGMFLNRDRIYEGMDYRAAEIGHTTLVPDGPMCYCGQRGCMDVYCASSNLSDMAGGDLEEFFKRVKARDIPYLQKWNEYLYYLSIAVNNIWMLFDCDVIIGGYVGSFIEPYLQELILLLQKRDTFKRSTNYVKACKYHTEAAAVGAGLMFVDQFIREV